MTPRQREFCRHYLAGLPAAQAAKAAGYAHTTAEKNAAEILSSPSVARYLERHRAAAQLVTVEHLAQVRDKMLTTLANDEGKASALAAHALLRLFRLAPELAARQSTLPQPPTEEIPAQTPDNQEAAPEENFPDHDTLPTGQPAFDHRLTPLKPEIITPKAALSLTFKSFLKHKANAAHRRKSPHRRSNKSTPRPQAPIPKATLSPATLSQGCISLSQGCAL